MKKTIKNPVLTCGSKKEMEVMENYLNAKGMCYEKSDNYVTIYRTFTLDELKSLMDIDNVIKTNRHIAISKIMLNWFGIDSILNNIDYTRENMMRYDNIKDSWSKGVEYEFINKGNLRFVTEDPIEAWNWIERGLKMESVDGRRQLEWEKEYGIEKEY